MKKLNKRNNINNLQTIEAYATICICGCPGTCSCWNGILWIGDTSTDIQIASANLSGIVYAS